MAVDPLPAREAQELLDRVFQSSAAEREQLGAGRVPNRVLASIWRRPWWASRHVSGLVGAFALGLWVAFLTWPTPKPIAAVAAATLTLVAALPAAFSAYRRARRSGVTVRTQDGAVGTERVWMPSYGELSRVYAFVATGGERFLAPPAFADAALVLFGRARLYLVRQLLAAVEVIDGTVVGRAPPAVPAPSDFLQIVACDPDGAEWSTPPPAAPAR
jgi:hypothetical protein